jgi:hypothetical protein
MRSLVLVLPFTLFMACNGDDVDPPEGDTDTDSDSDTDTDTDTDTDADVEVTLDNCVTDIAAGAPAFFHDYYKCVTVTMSGSDVKITSEGKPPHLTPYYDDADANYVAFDDRGGSHFQNPNTLGDADIDITIPSAPVAKGLTIDDSLVDTTMMTSDEEYDAGTQGVALDGVAMFNAAAAPGDDIWDEQYTFDLYEGHPAGTTYHYHWNSAGPLEVLEHQGFVTKTEPGTAEIEVYGIMCDGTVVLGCTELDGTSPPATSDLDAQMGHKHDISDGTTVHFADRYHTHTCASYTDHPFFPEIAYYETTNCPAGGGGPP